LESYPQDSKKANNAELLAFVLASAALEIKKIDSFQMVG
jgi:hypothetical protein